MKKLLLILATFVGFAFSVNAQNYVDIWEESGSILYQTKTNNNYTIEIEYTGYTNDWRYIDSFSESKVLSSNRSDYIAKAGTKTLYDIKYIKFFTQGFDYIDVWEEGGSILYQTKGNNDYTIKIEYSSYTKDGRYVDNFSESKVLSGNRSDYIAKAGTNTVYEIRFIKFYIR